MVNKETKQILEILNYKKSLLELKLKRILVDILANPPIRPNVSSYPHATKAHRVSTPCIAISMIAPHLVFKGIHAFCLC